MVSLLFSHLTRFHLTMGYPCPHTTILDLCISSNTIICRTYLWVYSDSSSDYHDTPESFNRKKRYSN